MAPRKPHSDDEAWIDEQPYGFGSIQQLSEKDFRGTPYEVQYGPMGFDISPAKSSADRIRKRKARK